MFADCGSDVRGLPERSEEEKANDKGLGRRGEETRNKERNEAKETGAIRQ